MLNLVLWYKKGIWRKFRVLLLSAYQNPQFNFKSFLSSVFAAPRPRFNYSSLWQVLEEDIDNHKLGSGQIHLRTLRDVPGISVIFRCRHKKVGNLFAVNNSVLLEYCLKKVSKNVIIIYFQNSCKFLTVADFLKRGENNE